MSPEFPYQLVSFLDQEPAIDEGVYQGVNGWCPQIALKRRFKIVGIDEKELFSLLNEFADNRSAFQLQTGELIKPESMPVHIIEIINYDDIMKFHLDFITFMSSHMESRYPERDGDNYLPHVTAEFWDKFVIDVDKFTSRTFTIDKICLIKDGDDTDSHVLAYFELGNQK